MPDYKQMYFKLAGLVADTIEALDEISKILKTVQCETEESFINGDNTITSE